MTDRLTVDTINSDQLDALQLRAARMEHAVAEHAKLRVQLEDAERERDEHKQSYLGACTTIAAMHAAAVGRNDEGPIRGVVEDVEDVRLRAEQAEAEVKRLGLMVDEYGAGAGALTDKLKRVRDLRDRWTQAGPPPLGVSLARWVDARLIELNTALDGGPTGSEEQDEDTAPVVVPAAERAAVLTEAADAVFALDYDEMVSEEEYEDLGSMREAWDLGTIHATQMLRRMAVESAAADQATTETHVELQVWPLSRVLAEVRCGSADWPWEDEWADLDQRHAETGYLARLEQQIRQNGITMPVLIGSDGRLWDGHHRLRIAVRLGISYVPVEIARPATPAPTDKDTEAPTSTT